MTPETRMESMEQPDDLYDVIWAAHNVFCPLPDPLLPDDTKPCACAMDIANLDAIADEMVDSLAAVIEAWAAHERAEAELSRCVGALKRVEKGEVSTLALAAEDAERQRDQTWEAIEHAEGALGEEFSALLAGFRSLPMGALDALRDGVLKWCEYWCESGPGGGWHFEFQVEELRELFASTIETPKSGLSSVALPVKTPIVYVLEEVGATRDIPIVKIGTTVAGWRRVASFDPKYPYELRPILALPGGRERERELHVRFKHLRLRGEWFRFVDELRLFVLEQRELLEKKP